jgi:hypothetical protein
MKMNDCAVKKIKWWVEMDLVGCEYSGEIEVGADDTDEQIEEVVRDYVFNHVSWGWSNLDEAEG